MKPIEKILLIFISVVIAIIVPVSILLLFHYIFADFYTKGFLTGLGHILICILMMFINVAYLPIVIYSSYKKNKLKPKQRDSRNRFYKAPIYLILASILVQVVLSILIENPFKDPPLPSFT